MASLTKRTWKNGPAWYIQYYVGNQQRCVRASDNYQIAKEKLRRFEAARAAGDELPLPTRTPIPEIVAPYVQNIRQIKTAKSAQIIPCFAVSASGAKVPWRRLRLQAGRLG